MRLGPLALLALVLVLAGCLGQSAPTAAGTETSPTDGPTASPVTGTLTERTATPAGTTGSAFGPEDCESHARLPRSAEDLRLPDSFDRLPSPPTTLSAPAIRRVALDYHAVVLDRRLANRTDIHDYGIGPTTTFPGAKVTDRSETGACVVVRVPYWLEPSASSVADTSEVATYFVNRTVVART